MKKLHSFKVGDVVILMTPHEIQEMQGVYLGGWRSYFGVVINEYMEEMCNSHKVWKVRDVDEECVFLDCFWFPWQIVKHVDGKSPIKQPVRFIRR